MASLSSVRAVYQKPARQLDNLGEELRFYVKALAWTPRAITRYKREILRILAEVTLGTGALAAGGVVGGERRSGLRCRRGQRVEFEAGEPTHACQRGTVGSPPSRHGAPGGR